MDVARVTTKTITKGVLSSALMASGLVGVQILTTDEWLWNAGPTHAYGLMIFAFFALVLAGAVWRLPKYALVGALLLAVIQFAAMTADLFIGAPAGVQQSEFRIYLLGNTAFVILLEIQPIVLGIAIALTGRIPLSRVD